MTAAIPQPKFAIGDIVEWQGRDREYFQRVYLRFLIKEIRKYSPKPGRLNKGHKNVIRDTMKVLTSATHAEIAGIVAMFTSIPIGTEGCLRKAECLPEPPILRFRKRY